MAHNLETLGGIHKKNVTLLESSLMKNCVKLSSLSLKNWGSLYQSQEDMSVKQNKCLPLL